MATSHKTISLKLYRPSAVVSLVLLGICLVIVFSISIFVGRYPQPYVMSPGLLWEDELARRLVMTLRLPRILTALLLGTTLSACGTVVQMIFRNPLVEPGFLGVTQGAAFGAAFSILWLSSSPLSTELCAALFALSGLFLSYSLARHMHFGGWILRLVLAGIVISALFSSGVGILKYIADPLSQLPAITFWMLGGLWSITWRDLLMILPVNLAGLIIIFLMRWRLNLLSMSDETAFSLGAAPARERILLLVAATSATAVVISISGIVGWIGLIIPHISRRLFGVNTRYSLPASMLAGGIFGMICDDIARTILAGEIPLGILTSLLGALIFTALMLSSNLKFKQ